MRELKAMSLQKRIKRLKAMDMPSSSSRPIKGTLVLKDEVPSSSLPDPTRKKENALALNIIEPSNANAVGMETLVHPGGPIPTLMDDRQ